MSKPEGIPQDVWDTASKETGGWMVVGGGDENAALVSTVARAILAERQRCEQIVAEVLQQININPHSEAVDDGGRRAAKKIAAGIKGDE